MKILFISDIDPFSHSFGGAQRTNLLYKALSDVGEVYILQCSSETRKISERHYKLALKPQRGIRRVINGLVCRILHMACPKFCSYYVPFPLQMDLAKLFPNTIFDLVVHRLICNAGLLHAWNFAPMIVDVDDEPVQAYDTIHKYDLNPFRRWIARAVIRLIVARILHNAKAFWLSNPYQVSACSQFKEKAHVLMNIPMLVDEVVAGASGRVDRDNYIFTVGLMSHPPNYLGIDEFVCNIWPDIRKKYPTLTYKIAGKELPLEYRNKWESVDGVEILGFVKDIESLYQNALASIVPIRAGSGTCIKVLESMVYSRVCISTKFGVRGIPESDIASGATNILIYDDINSLMSDIDIIIANKTLREELEKKGNLYYRKNFSFEQFSDQVKSVIFNVI